MLRPFTEFSNVNSKDRLKSLTFEEFQGTRAKAEKRHLFQALFRDLTAPSLRYE